MPASRSSHKLILFDIDGTLVRMQRGLPGKLFQDMAKDAWGREVSMEGFGFHGRTDKAIIAHVGKMAGLGEHELDHHESLAAEWLGRELENRLTLDTLELLPNVAELLEELALRDDCTLAVLTGNLPRCAEVKLSIHGLDKYFAFGVYGIESHDRNDLGPIALARANELIGRTFTGRDTVVIGDTQMDIDCANAIGAKCILTLTGRAPLEKLTETPVLRIFDDLSDTNAVIEAIFRQD